jgi:hypothetical protein
MVVQTGQDRDSENGAEALSARPDAGFSSLSEVFHTRWVLYEIGFLPAPTSNYIPEVYLTLLIRSEEMLVTLSSDFSWQPTTSKSGRPDCPTTRAPSAIVITACLFLLLLGCAPSNTQVSQSFFVRSYAGKCLDFGPAPQVAGSPVFVFDCNRTEAQQLRIEEINVRHEVVLRAGRLVIGIHNPLVNTLDSVASASEFPLELQDEVSRLALESRNQIFAIDGDSIILAANRDLVVQINNARGANRAPLVAGTRNLADNEFWDFNAVDDSDKDPTSGFVRVATREELVVAMININQAAQNNNGEAWGSVVRIIDTGDPIQLTGNPAFIDANGLGRNLVLPTGVTVRGDRRGTNLGPRLLANFAQLAHMLEVNGNHVRITGLRVQGPTRSNQSGLPTADGLWAHSDRFTHTIIDHNDLSDWPNAAIEVFGGQGEKQRCPPADPSRNDRVRIERNFIHHNEQAGIGYGIVMSDGGAATIRGNTFLMNRHAIAADGELHDQYRTWHNLVLSNAPGYGITAHRQQDFDMHGTAGGSSHDGGFAGNQVDVGWNTFLGGNRANFTLRGTPCATDLFHDNVTMRSSDDAIRMWDFGGNELDIDEFPSSSLMMSNNQFGQSDPTASLAVGDFNADRSDDLFLATGAAWYYSPGGKAEWRFLSAKTDTIEQLLFGDFDGDGRTDVVAIHGRNLVVSWGGISDWELLNSTPPPAAISEMAVGNFVGDWRSDIFFADGQQWWVSDAGQASFVPVNTSSFRVHDLRFGDFDGDGKPDVFGVVTGAWRISSSAQSGWTFWRSKLTDSVQGLVVADFDGDGFADVASNCDEPACWRISFRGLEEWRSFSQPYGLVGPELAGIGRFLAKKQADVLSWNVSNPYWMCDPNVGQNTEFCVAVGGTTPVERYSRQDMR